MGQHEHHHQEGHRMTPDTKPRTPCRALLIGLLASLDETEHEDVQEAAYAMLDEINSSDQLDLPLGAITLIVRLAAALERWPGLTRPETLRELAAAVAADPTP